MRRALEVGLGILLGLLIVMAMVAIDANRPSVDDIAGAVGELHDDSKDKRPMTTWRIVGSGDSILAMTLGKPAPGGALLTSQAWINTEHGRNAWTAGMANQASLASIWPLVLARSQRNGFIVIQDNGLGVSDSAWTILLQRIVDETPDDRTLVFILPCFHWLWNAQYHNQTTVRRRIMSNIATQHRRRVVIDWSKAVLGDRTMVYDGQHPSARGRIWLQRALRGYTGLAV